MPANGSGRGTSGMVLALTGIAGAIATLICLIELDFTLFDLVYYVPALGLSAFLILWGRARMKKQ